MVEDDPGIRKFLCKISEFGDLSMKTPGLKAQIALLQFGEADAEIRIHVSVRTIDEPTITDPFIRLPICLISNTAKAATTSHG